jgi:hypothetical protein
MRIFGSLIRAPLPTLREIIVIQQMKIRTYGDSHTTRSNTNFQLIQLEGLVAE